MRKVVVSLFIVVLFFAICLPYGCTDKKPVVTDSISSDTTTIDSSGIDSTEQVISETPMPKAADALFDDFIFNFAANRKLQKSRIVFPLKVYRNGKLDKEIPAAKWKTEHFFMRQEYYTLIFNSSNQKDVVKDTARSHVQIEKIYLRNQNVEEFDFDRQNGKWMMTSVRFESLKSNPNHDFLVFYEKFATDSLFQIQSLADEVNFTAPDPNDDFSTIDGVIVPQQWPDFKPGLIPSGIIYNIVYGQNLQQSNKRVFVIRGISNGLEIEMTFKRLHGNWKLVKFNS